MSKDGGQAFPEEWLFIDWFPDYEISNYGNIRSHKRNKIRLMNPSTNSKGYKVVILRRNNKKYNFWVSNLVLSNFKCSRPENLQCCHNDGNKTNNVITNLRWDTPSNNTKDQVKHGLHAGLKRCGENHPLHKLDLRQIETIRFLVNEGYPCKRISEFMDIPRTTVSSVKHGYSWRKNNGSDKITMQR